MVATVITESNCKAFMPGLDDELLKNSDIFFGAVDEDTNTAVGVMAVKDIKAEDGKELEITYIYVSEEFRGRGAGRAMVEMLKTFAIDYGAFVILCISSFNIEDAGVHELLCSCGFDEVIDSTSSTYEAYLMDIHIPGKGEDKGIVPLSSLSRNKWRALEARFDESEKRDNAKSGHIIRQRDFYDEDISMIRLGPKEEILGAVLVSAYEDVISIDVCAAFEGDAGNIMLSLFRSSAKEAYRLYGGEILVSVTPPSEEMYRLFEKFTGGLMRKSSDTVAQYYVI
ncbi:GNAT family N-acetyltransferase [Butyrivibrio sp. FCS014]|uniref:GNAT family N-acetyltransferase n=1 Tax=Butyrivibrio sp. FCS014 TaxID=1408304 RepID=UPI000467C32A|nr:GNAT family N-acetyltransferase [Butyrivibrio sp. FCS014]